MSPTPDPKKLKFADTIRVVRQGWGGPPVVFINDEPFLFLTDKIEIGEVSQSITPTITITIPANRVLLVNDVLNRDERDRRASEQLAAEAAVLDERGESGG